jgi:anti-anti-sigma factor
MADDVMVVYGEAPGVAVVVLVGEHEAFGSARLERQLASLVEEGFAVVVDLSRATFVDSATLLALLRSRRAADERGLGFVLQMDVSTGQYVRRIFDLTRLTSVFATAPTRPEAVAAARAGGAAPQPGTEPA